MTGTAVTSPPMMTTANGRCVSLPTPVESAAGIRPRIARSAVISTTRKRLAAPEASAHEGHIDDGVFDSWVDYTQALKDAGALLAAEQLQEVDTATTVRLRGTDRLLTDGPFIETKEHLLGFYLLEVPDLDTAIDWSARMPIVRRGTVEVRPVKRDGAWRAALE